MCQPRCTQKVSAESLHCAKPANDTMQLLWCSQTAWHCINMQALLPCIAQLSGLPLRELVLDIQSFSHPATFLALFQQLPRTLRQLALRSTESRGFGAAAEKTPLPPAGLLPARVQTTALRQVRRHGHARLFWYFDGHLRAHNIEGGLHCRSLLWYHACGRCTCVSTSVLTTLATSCDSVFTDEARLAVARRELELYAIDAADAMLADMLQQLPFLTVCDTVLCGRHGHINVHIQNALPVCSNVACKWTGTRRLFWWYS
jgi:hypothetical protein